jgi:Prp8 binding protein
MLLTGHGGEVLTVKFSPSGDVVASGSHDRHLFLWRTYGECENFMMIKGARGSSA